MLCQNYNTHNAYINNTLINANEYTINPNNEILCKNNHKLSFVDGQKVKKYFRHKNREDLYINSRMTNWHKEWQESFEHTEIPFNKLNEAQIKNRRCDILIDDYIIEIQHSKQTEDEVNNRLHDYTTINNKEIIWIIDGENSTVTRKDNRIIIEINDQWKVDNYKKWDFIFLDINKIIYKIYPRIIQNKMIDCNESYTKEEFINILKNNIKAILNINIPKQCNLYLKQQGAGNGKTYGIIQQINNNDFEYDDYVLITKQHSAKFNIYDEFEKQQALGLIYNLKNYESNTNGKKYTIEFERNHIKKTIIIGTVDSLFYAISNNYIKKDKYSNIFKKMVEEVCNGVVVNKNIDKIMYSKNVTLHKKTCLIIDETQDLDNIYASAIKNIMETRYIDCYMVGDLLQSIEFEDNAFKYLLDYKSQFINIDKLEYSNLIRRFNNKEFIKFVNFMVEFEKYNLPNMQCEIATIENKDALNLKLINKKNKDDDMDINYCDEIMNIYEQEIANGYKKEDILIITPIVSKGSGNKIMTELETRIRQYWNNILDDNQYKEYAKFHKSEEGSSIDLNESKNSTRLISIKTSKGLGHKVVIVFGLTDKNLFKFSKNKKNIIYDSMIHVALTRMKEKLHVLFEDNKDSLSKKFIEYYNENNEDKKYPPNLNLSKHISYKNIIDLNLNNDFRFEKNIEEPLMEIIEKLDKKIIDMSHHKIRYSTMISYISIKIIHSIDNYEKQQLIQILKKIYKSDITLVDNWKNYLKTNHLPIFELKYKNINSENKIYNDILYKFIKSVKNKCNDIINKKLETLCSFEMIILHYLLEIVDNDSRKYSTISPIDIFNIINAYYKSFSYQFEGHDNCLCKKLFNNNEEHPENEMQRYISTHYDSLKLLDKQFTNFIKDKHELKWLYKHHITLGSNNNDYRVYNDFVFICYNNQNVYILSLKPQLSDINYINNMIEMYYNQYLIENINTYPDSELDEYNLNRKNNRSIETYNPNIENYIKFGNKNIIPILISLNNQAYISPNFGTIDLKKNIITSLYNYMITDNNLVYYLFRYYYDQVKLEKPKYKICNIINNIKMYINDDKTKGNYPNHLIDFLNKIRYNLENIDKCSDRKKYLNLYLNMDKFIEEYSLFIKKAIHNYLNIVDESDDESDTESDDDSSNEE